MIPEETNGSTVILEPMTQRFISRPIDENIECQTTGHLSMLSDYTAQVAPVTKVPGHLSDYTAQVVLVTKVAVTLPCDLTDVTSEFPMKATRSRHVTRLV